MFPPWRFKLREAQVALEQGRLDEAAQIAGQPQLRQFLPVQQLAGRKSASNSPARWNGRRREILPRAGADLDKRPPTWPAKRPTGSACQQAVADVAVGDIVQHLEASDFSGRGSRLDVLDKRKIPGVALHTLRESRQATRIGPQAQPARQIRRGRRATGSSRTALRPDF